MTDYMFFSLALPQRFPPLDSDWILHDLLLSSWGMPMGEVRLFSECWECADLLTFLTLPLTENSCP